MGATYVIQKTCPICHDPNPIRVPEEGYRRWQAGEHVQDAFPDLSEDQREGLISGTHGKCYDRMFPPEEE